MSTTIIAAAPSASLSAKDTAAPGTSSDKPGADAAFAAELLGLLPQPGASATAPGTAGKAGGKAKSALDGVVVPDAASVLPAQPQGILPNAVAAPAPTLAPTLAPASASAPPPALPPTAPSDSTTAAPESNLANAPASVFGSATTTGAVPATAAPAASPAVVPATADAIASVLASALAPKTLAPAGPAASAPASASSASAPATLSVRHAQGVNSADTPTVTAPVASAVAPTTTVVPAVPKGSGSTSPDRFGEASAPVTVADPAALGLAPHAEAPRAVTTGAPAPVVSTQTPAPMTAQLARPILDLRTAALGTHVLTVHVTPDALGPVTVRAHLTSDSLSIELSSPTGDGRDALRTLLPDLKRDLADGGMQASVDVSSQADAGPGPGTRQDEQADAGRGSAAGGSSADTGPSRATARGEEPANTAIPRGTSSLDVLA